MKLIDRMILGLLASSIWLGIGFVLLLPKPLYALKVDASDVSGLEKYIRNVVEKCAVYGNMHVRNAEEDDERPIDQVRIGKIKC